VETFGSFRTATGETLLYSGNPSEEYPHVKGVGFILSKMAADSVKEWEPVSPHII